MRIAVPRESDAGEPRVAATPDTIKKLKSFGAEVAVARGAGIASGIPDTDFEAAGAQVADAVTKDADIVLKCVGLRRTNWLNTKKVRWLSP